MRRVDPDGLARMLVHNVQAAEPPRRAQRVRDEIHAPALVRSLERRANHAGSLAPAPLPLPTDGEALFAVDALHPLLADWPAFAPEMRMHSPVTPPDPFVRQLPDPAPERLLRRTHTAVPHRRARETRVADRPPLADPHRGLDLPDDAPPLTRRHDLFPSRSFRTWRLTAWSATIRFSRRFSSSSWRSRRASLTCIPPYFCFQR